MNNVIFIDPVEDPRWDKFVENHPFGWICHLSGWKKVLENSFKHMNGYYPALLDLNNNIRAALPIYEVKSWLTGHRLISIPSATLCDPLISSNEEMNVLLDAALNLSKNLGASFIEIRTLSSHDLIKDKRFGNNKFYKNHFLLLDDKPEQLKKRFHRGCVRQRINRGVKSGLSIKKAENEFDLQRFYRLYLINRKQLGLPPQPFIFFKLLWETFFKSGHMVLFLAIKQRNVYSGLILFAFKERVSAEYLVSDMKYRNLSPNHFLIWEAIKYAYDCGYKIFDFGRTSPNNSGLMDFKARWGTKVVDLPQFFYPQQKSNNLYNREKALSYKCISSICKKAPSFALPYIGYFCYRHLG